MNYAVDTRNALHLTTEEMAVLLRSTESQVILEELRAREETYQSPSWGLYMLLSERPSHCARVLIEKQLKLIVPNSARYDALATLAQKLGARSVI